MHNKPEDIWLLVCQCMKTLLTRQEKMLEFSRAAFEALWKRQPLEQGDAERLRILLRELDDAQTLRELQVLRKELEAVVLDKNP
ncbi:MAG: hypothetical protein ABSE93_19870 [Terriglobia bacterium]